MIAARCRFIVLISAVLVVYSGFWSKDKNDGVKVDSATDGSEMYDYGVDISYPIHHKLNPNSYWGKQYDKMMSGCYSKYSKNLCEANDLARIEMNFEQPATQHNYTDIGFKKIRAPEKLYKIILDFYNKYKGQDTPENWPAGSIYVNHWDSPTTMINFENTKFRGGYDTKQMIWDAAKPVIEEWTGKKQTATSLYGVRVYHNGAVLATHVDRLPLVSSAIIQVDQDLDEPWPLEVYARDGKAYNVTMEPGDMVLYESHTTLHGRPFPMKGRFYANVFVHFAPFDHDEENENDARLIELRKKDNDLFRTATVVEGNRKLKGALDPVRNQKGIGGHEHDNHPQDAVQKHLEELMKREAMLKDLHSKNPEAYKSLIEKESKENEGKVPKGRTDLHFAAALGLIENVRNIIGDKHTDIINARDENGWQAIHEAARGGYVDILKYLVDMGADIGAQTMSLQTPLSIAKSTLKEDHEAVKYLESLGAPDSIEIDLSEYEADDAKEGEGEEEEAEGDVSREENVDQSN